MTGSIRFILNGEDVSLTSVRATETLLDYLRLQRRLTGTKEGCAEGDCGACTVLVGRLLDGVLVYEGVNACIRFLASLHGTHVVTVEHLAGADGALHPIQQAMVDFHGSQCGFCTPGFVMSLYGLWLAKEKPGRADIEKALQGNLCRCTGYEPIVRAAEQVTAARPSSIFDPLERARTDILARLWALKSAETIRMEKDGETLVIPATVNDLAQVLAQTPDATVVAGSTDVGLWVTKQMRPLKTVVFINNLSELQTIQVSDKGISIGAGVTYTQALDTLALAIPALGPLLCRIGGEQVRNMGTIGGNIANGSPIGDTPPPLIALGASVNLHSAAGTRMVPLDLFFIDYGKQDRQPGEFVESIFVPLPAPENRFAVYKISKRRDEDISAVCGAFNLTLDGDNIVQSIRIAYGGMAATPKRALAAEAFLRGKPWTEETVREAQAHYDRDFKPLSDWRASAGYRQLTAKNLLMRFFLETAGDAERLTRFEAVA